MVPESSFSKKQKGPQLDAGPDFHYVFRYDTNSHIIFLSLEFVFWNILCSLRNLP